MFCISQTFICRLLGTLVETISTLDVYLYLYWSSSCLFTRNGSLWQNGL